MYPLLLDAPIIDYLWGGTKLIEQYGFSTEKKIAAEAWVLSCHKDGDCIVKNGKYSGKNLSDVLRIWGQDAIGEKSKKFPNFPILIKFIDAKDRLSLQVHPDDNYAKRVEGEFGKTEMWYVIDCEPDSYLIYGLKEEISKEEFKNRIKNNSIEDVCNKVPVNKGDVFFIPAGTIHAIGKGILIAEVQQNSNSTYRVSDYGRLGADGKPRELQIEKAVDVTKLNPTELPYGNIGTIQSFSFGTVRNLADCDLFSVNLIKLRGVVEVGEDDTFVSLVIIDGECSYEFDNETFNIKKGESIFIPAHQKITINGNAQILYSKV